MLYSIEVHIDYDEETIKILHIDVEANNEMAADRKARAIVQEKLFVF